MTRARRSIRSTLLLWLLPFATVLMLIAWVVHGALMDAMLRNFLSDRLQQEADYIVSRIEEEYPDLDSWFESDTFFAEAFHHMVAIRIGLQSWSNPQDLAATLEPLELPTTSEKLFIVVDQRRLYAVQQPFHIKGQPGVVIVAEDLEQLESDEARLHLWVGVVSVVLLCMLVVLIIAAIHLSLRPLKALRHSLADLQAGRISRFDQATPVEFLGLVRQLNSLLDTLDKQVRKSREALGNLSHSIKTPVTALTQILEDRTVEIDQALRQQMTDRLRTLHRQLDAELRRNRLSGPQAGKTASLSSQTRNLLWMLGRLYPQKRFELESGFGPSDRWPIEEQDFNELLGNLVDNAGKWASSVVVVTLKGSRRQFCIQVEDDGPGVPEDQRSLLGNRGFRIDDQREGHGLGLAIVRELVSDYGGVMDISASARLGGLCVRVELTMAESSPTIAIRGH
ncbi:sensor histidine kinase [Allohahella sp. A8]|uniref:sensor histidine kinase n=1 Tax=Allohahella sp. A8 TaxID=3141461 RepID=UPI003A7F8DF1